MIPIDIGKVARLNARGYTHVASKQHVTVLPGSTTAAMQLPCNHCMTHFRTQTASETGALQRDITSLHGTLFVQCANAVHAQYMHEEDLVKAISQNNRLFASVSQASCLYVSVPAQQAACLYAL
eukprot:1161798-Pelagomonas_calceolata.AAC.12